MFSTVYNSQTVFIVDNAWNGAGTFDAEFSLLRDAQDSLTKREGRRPFSATLRTTLKYTATVQDNDLVALQGALRNWTTQPVVVPLWPLMTRWADRASMPVAGGLQIVWKSDWSQFAIYTADDGEPGWPTADDNVAPALWGFIAPTQPNLLTPDAATWDIKFTESSDTIYALAPAAFSPAAGPQPAGYAAALPLFPFQPDFSRVAEQISVEIKREDIGFTRDKSVSFYPQAAARAQVAGYTLTNVQIGQLLQFFLSSAGPGAPFWSSGYLAVADLSQDIAAADTILHVASSGAVKAGDYLMLRCDPDQIMRKVQAVGSGTITLTVAVGANLPAAAVNIFPLCLARLDKPAVKFSWADMDVAMAQLQWTELPAEYVPASDETLGTTLGRLAGRVIFFQFDRDYGNGTVHTDFFTSYEDDIVYNTHTWLHSNLSHGDIVRSLNLENDGTDLTGFIVAGNPLVQDIALQSEAPLYCTISWANYDGVNVTNVTQMFAGDVARASRQGKKITAKCTTGKAVLDSQLPILVRGTMCNHLKGSNNDGSFLISAGCTLIKADFKFTATVANPISGAHPILLYIANLTGVGGSVGSAVVDTNYFALGWVEWGAGANLQRRYIIKSTAASGGALHLTLHKWFNGTGPVLGDSLVLYPGCDGVHTTCQSAKFLNYLNFGGEPFTPVGSPTLIGAAVAPVSGGKK